MGWDFFIPCRSQPPARPNVRLAVLLVLTAACSPACTASPRPPDRSHVELEGLYLSAKQLEAIAAADRYHAEPFRVAAQEFMRPYFIASDWATEEDAQAVVKAYGEAIPLVKAAAVNLANKETWARMADAEPREEAALN
jgi:hypothetical protein